MMYICVYMCVRRERERRIERGDSIHMYICTHTQSRCVYVQVMGKNKSQTVLKVTLRVILKAVPLGDQVPFSVFLCDY